MKTSLVIAIVSALPLLAQEPAPQEAPAAPQGDQPQAQGMHRHRGQHMQGPRGQHRGMMNPEQRKQILEKFDTDKDGKLSEEERKAMREEFMKNRPQMPGRPGAQGPHGPRGPHGMNPEQRQKMLEKFDTDKDGKLSEEERKAAREEFMKNRPQMPDRRGGHGHWNHGPQGGPQGAPQGEQPQAPAQPAPQE